MEKRIAYVETRVQCPCGTWDTYRSQIHEDDFGDLVWACKRCGRENHIAVRTFTVVEDQAQEPHHEAQADDFDQRQEQAVHNSRIQQLEAELEAVDKGWRATQNDYMKVRWDLAKALGEIAGLKFALEHRS